MVEVCLLGCDSWLRRGRVVGRRGSREVSMGKLSFWKGMVAGMTKGEGQVLDFRWRKNQKKDGVGRKGVIRKACEETRHRMRTSMLIKTTEMREDGTAVVDPSVYEVELLTMSTLWSCKSHGEKTVPGTMNWKENL